MTGVRQHSRWIWTPLVVALALAGCTGGGDDEERVVAATPFAITIETSRVGDPTDQAVRHCAQYNRKAVSRGGIEVGEPAWKILWGFDCVDP